VSARAKAVEVAAEVEGEPLEPSSVGKGEGRRSRRRSRGRAPRAELSARAKAA